MTSLHKSFAALLIAVAAAVLSPRAALATEVNFADLNVPQGFNFQRDVQSPVGYLVSLKVGTTVIKPDLQVVSSQYVLTGAPGTTAVVGVMSSVMWSGGAADPIAITAEISTANRAIIETLIHNLATGTAVTFDFIVYNFDPVSSVYFPSLARATFFTSPTTPLTGLVSKTAGGLALSVAATPNTAVRTPLNFALKISVTPNVITQQIIVAFSPNQSGIKQW